MLNLFRMDVYRLLRSKSVYICFALLIFAHLLTFLLLFALTNPAAIEFLTSHGATFTINGGSYDANAVQSSFAGISVLEIFRQGTISGGAFTCLVGIIASIFICSDFSSGFIKNILSSHENKWDYILSKICSLCLINFIFLAAAFLVTLLSNVVFGGFFDYTSLADAGFYLLTIWMIQNGFSGLVLFLCVLTRNIGAAITGTLVLGSGAIIAMLHALLGLFGFEWITENTLYYSLSLLTTSFETGYHWRACLTGLFFCIFYTVIGKIVLSKKDL